MDTRTVVMVCRDGERGEAARAAIAREPGFTPDLLVADLSLQESFRRLAEEFTGRYSRLDVLIHNAAAFDASLTNRRVTQEGFEAILRPITWGRFC